MLEKTLESPLDSKAVNPKGNQPWIFTGRTDAEAPILWSHNAKNWLIGKDPDAGKDWRQEEKETAEDEIVVSLSKLQELLMDREAWHAAVHGITKSQNEQLNWPDSTLKLNK